jgi:hypothetical protein
MELGISTGPSSNRQDPAIPRSLEDQPRYWLRQHIYPCAVQDSVVFLDIKRDRYFGLSGRQLDALAAVVEGWPTLLRPSTTIERVSLLQARCIADQCVEAGLLTQDIATGKPAIPVSLSLAADLIAVGLDLQRSRPLQIRDVAYFLTACFTASYLLRLSSLETIVQRVTARKQQASNINNSDSFDSLIGLVCTFRRLRSFLPSGKDQCLFYALALVEFLAHYHEFPTFVIGVQTSPWAAHSWVQQGSLVLDSSPETVRFYTPILAV